MDTENTPAENVTEAASPPVNDKNAALWRLIKLALCAVGVGLVIGILALQVTEYLFFKAPPNVWPQQGAGGSFSAPAALPVTLTMPSAAPASATTTTASSEAATSTGVGVTSAAAVSAASAPAPAAATP